MFADEITQLRAKLQAEQGDLSSYMEKQAKLSAQKADLEVQLAEKEAKLAEEERMRAMCEGDKSRAEREMDSLKHQYQDVNARYEKLCAEKATTSVYLIGVFVALITLFFLSLIVAYYRRRSVLVSGTMGSGLETESRRPLAPSSAPPVEIVGQQQQERGRAVGADPVGVASAVAGSSNGLLYDR